MAAQCPTHPEVETVFACARCGTFACGPCGVHLVEEHLGATVRVCLKCRDQVAQKLLNDATRPSTRAGLIFWLGLFLGFSPIALLVFALAAVELRAIRAGGAPLAGRGWAQGGVGLCLCWWGGIALLVLKSRY